VLFCPIQESLEPQASNDLKETRDAPLLHGKTFPLVASMLMLRVDTLFPKFSYLFQLSAKPLVDLWSLLRNFLGPSDISLCSKYLTYSCYGPKLNVMGPKKKHGVG
jgi:hypothetical protein